MKVDKYKQRVAFTGEDGEELVVQYDNRGDPYSEGVTIELRDGYDKYVGVYLEKREAGDLRDLIDKLYPQRTAKAGQDGGGT